MDKLNVVIGISALVAGFAALFMLVGIGVLICIECNLFFGVAWIVLVVSAFILISALILGHPL